ncbi:hypothetical protein EDC61_103217 [Sulfuritortus calidifontis]|uniref:DUF4381 family protein n=1 Tax=Sulfuritortus calidifontis TaxID=1914471 RepID=A0A4R3JXN8_9PROT|nr:hypothetical protein [Sulfuritortus calidifontis]TCS73094.1 hypothetical protein EDC61_103217 [Sulfuritortus calidifontis]
MPDPIADLADIVEPAIPVAAATGGDWPVVAAGVASGLALLLGLYWHWRRRAPRRALQRLRIRTDPQRAAGELAALLPQFKRAPEAQWREELQRLRFGPPQDDAQAVFERLCREAETMLVSRVS